MDQPAETRTRRRSQPEIGEPAVGRPKPPAPFASVLGLQLGAGNAAVVELLTGPRARGSTVQRDLAAYDERQTKRMGLVTIEHSADARAIRAALSALVSAGKVRRRYDGGYSIFAATGATKAEVEAALAAARFPRAAEMADALLADRQVRVYSNERLTLVDKLFGGQETARIDKERLETPDARPLSAAEREAANKVFAGAVQLDGVRIAVGGPMTVGGYARTIPDKIYFPDADFSLGLLIHELTHVWQYQEDEPAAAVIEDALFASYDYGGPMYLAEAWASGHSFSHFNHEQQGDILQDYYRELGGAGVGAYQPFVDQVRNGTWRGPRNLEKERQEREARARPAPAPAPAPGPVGPSLFDQLGDLATEAGIVSQLQLRIGADDTRAQAGRKKTLLELFGRFAPDVAAATLGRIRARRPGDLMVQLLHRRVSTATRAEIENVLAAKAPSR